MPQGELYIKKTNRITPVSGALQNGWVDTFIQWGVSFSESALSALMTPAPNKEMPQNKNRVNNGKVIVHDTSIVVKDERAVSLEMHITAKNKTDFWDKYDRFCTEVLEGGFLEIKNNNVPTKVFRMFYENCTQFSEFNGLIAKFTLRLNEPNPSNRSI